MSAINTHTVHLTSEKGKQRGRQAFKASQPFSLERTVFTSTYTVQHVLANVSPLCIPTASYQWYRQLCVLVWVMDGLKLDSTAQLPPFAKVACIILAVYCSLSSGLVAKLGFVYKLLSCLGGLVLVSVHCTCLSPSFHLPPSISPLPPSLPPFSSVGN